MYEFVCGVPACKTGDDNLKNNDNVAVVPANLIILAYSFLIGSFVSHVREKKKNRRRIAAHHARPGSHVFSWEKSESSATDQA